MRSIDSRMIGIYFVVLASVIWTVVSRTAVAAETGMSGEEIFYPRFGLFSPARDGRRLLLPDG